ncbi:RTA1 like protein-domain-containing protein [Vararia minispora EC-137]|uniref:RTA1 like protein-domain-containing protein n=1 Tax=Vararia minispora EC-137 TaxID=1314806 RepID=A0ACB8QX33_9AGAM|nr:RTA1 like protein-domain-containing protein [Vararia minispora EC-137]
MPSERIAIVFVVLFGLSTVIHLGQCLYYGLWFLIPTVVLCGVGEIIGWSGRLWSSLDVLNDSPITSTVLAPTPFIAANFIILGRIIDLFGERYSRLSSKAYTWIFLTVVRIQSTGGGIASDAYSFFRTLKGSNVILAGIVFQLVSLVSYALLAAEFLWRYAIDAPIRHDESYQRRTHTTSRMRLLLLAYPCVTRAVYRTVELADGWYGPVIRTQWPFDVFEGSMIVLVMYTMNFLHPGCLLLPEEESRLVGYKHQRDPRFGLQA